MSNDLHTYGDIVRMSHEFLAKKKVPSPKCDAEWIVSHASGKNRMEIYLDFEEIVPPELVAEIRKLVVERGRRVPLQHLMRTVEFCEILINCDSRALIPRQETERLVEIVMERVGDSFAGKILDLGTGSGAIVVALCKHMKKSVGLGMDNSADAISLARENADLSGLSEKIRFELFDWTLESFDSDRVDLLIANPPYLSEEDWLSCEPEVRIHDPRGALVSGEGGLSHIKALIKIAPQILQPDGYFFMEMGKGQADFVYDYSEKIFAELEIVRDFAGIRRFLCARGIQISSAS